MSASSRVGVSIAMAETDLRISARMPRCRRVRGDIFVEIIVVYLFSSLLVFPDFLSLVKRSFSFRTTFFVFSSCYVLNMRLLAIDQGLNSSARNPVAGTSSTSTRRVARHAHV